MVIRDGDGDGNLSADDDGTEYTDAPCLFRRKG
jgi:hypothetical protein